MQNSILSKVTTGRRGRAQKCCIYGPEGYGKSTMASLFPSPLFLDVEDSTSQLDVMRLGRQSLPDLRAFESALDEVAKHRPCATLVVDTVDWVEEMGAVELCEEHKVKNIEEVAGGFGKGYNFLTTRFSITLAKLDAIIDAGIHVVLLAHASIIRFDPPDGAGAFDRYELKLYKDRKGGKGTASLIKEWCDLLIFGNWRTQIAEKGKGENVKYKGVGGRERLMHCNRTAAWDAKNRHGLGDVEKWEIATIEKAFRAVGAPWGNEPQPLQSAAPAACGSGEAKPEPQKPQPEPPRDTAPAAPAAAQDPDGIPGVPNPVDAELARICEPHAEAVTNFLRERNQIKADQDWRSTPPDYAARIKKNPANFLKMVLNGKAVTA